jgi:hypothetical protein
VCRESQVTKWQLHHARRREACLRTVGKAPPLTPRKPANGRLSERDAQNSDAIRKALEDFLRELYWRIGEPDGDDPPKYAMGSFGREYTALRDQTSQSRFLKNHKRGLLKREADVWKWRLPPTRYLITRRAAALRCAITPPDSPHDLADFPPGALMGDYLDEPAAPVVDYDLEEDLEEASADLRDEALADAFDKEGYEKGKMSPGQQSEDHKWLIRAVS